MHVLDNTLECERCESSAHAIKGCRPAAGALPISPPALGLESLMCVVSDSGHLKQTAQTPKGSFFEGGGNHALRKHRT
jgi:hypothetical protein